MVNFRGRSNTSVGDDVNVEVSDNGKTIYLNVPLKPASLAVESFLKSDRLTDLGNHTVSAELEYEGDRLLRRRVKVRQFKSTSLSGTKGGVADGKEEEATVLCYQKIDGTEITLSGQLLPPQNSRDDRIYSLPALGQQLAEFLQNNPKKAALGYGPQHPLDDIDPTELNWKDKPEEQSAYVSLFGDWINRCIDRTRSTNKEYAFYNDEAGNTVGIIEGRRSHVSYPHAMIDEINFSFHLHPRTRTIPWPSMPDLGFMAAHKVGAVHCIGRGLHNTYFTPRDEQVDDGELTGREGVVTLNTMDETSLLTVKVVSGDRVKDFDDYLDEWFSIKDTVIDRDAQVAMNQVEQHSGQLDPDIVNSVLDEIEDANKDFYNMDPDDKEERLREIYDSQNKVFVPEYHRFELDQYDKEPTKRY